MHMPTITIEHVSDGTFLFLSPRAVFALPYNFTAPLTSFMSSGWYVGPVEVSHTLLPAGIEEIEL